MIASGGNGYFPCDSEISFVFAIVSPLITIFLSPRQNMMYRRDRPGFLLPEEEQRRGIAMAQRLQASRFQLGACYYPEQWPSSLWEDDFRRMRELGFSVIRIAEFAWTIFEPEEGTFRFDFFDRVMDLAHQYNIGVILGTPTATPPAWLTAKYPEVLNVSQAGVIYQHGQRRHYNYNSAIYQQLSQRIAGQMAAHYHSHPALIGWQIDNELNCEVNVFYSEADHQAFRIWLQKRYETLEQLNEAWGATFWNQTYSDWGQVALTRPSPSNAPNPHQALDEKRFISDSTIYFARLQAEAIRQFDTTHWITTNGIFGHLDSHRLTQDALNFISYDSYPQFSQLWPDEGPDPLLDRRFGLSLSTVRNISPNFCVMEQQSGPGGWVNRIEHPTPKPGQMRLWTYQSIAHGADMLLYFRWRTASYGTEIYWHGINDYHNRPNRRVFEAATVGRELAEVGSAIVGSTYQATVALVKDYDNDWDGEFDTWTGPSQQQSAQAWFKALQHSHIPTDVVYLQPESSLADLSRYQCLVYGHPAIMSERTAELLEAYVRNGGTLILGCRTGYKDLNGHCPMRPMPGPVADLCGVTVEDFTRIGAYQQSPSIQWKEQSAGENLIASTFNDILHVEQGDVEVVATYGTDADYYAGKPVLTRRVVGQGTVYYYGATFNASTARAMIQELGLVSPVARQFTLPKQVELAIREQQDGRRVVFLLNYANESQTIQVHQPATNLFTGETLHGEVILAAYDVLLFL
jgi:beta-galactosidase